MSGGIAALFRSFRTVQSRGVMVLVLDVPSEDGPAAVAYLGSPVPGAAIHVALKPLAALANAADDLGTVVHGTFESYRLHEGRSSLALTIDVPSERSHVVLKQLGMPTLKRPVPVAVARLRGAPPQPATPRKDPGVLAVQRAALRCKDSPFQRFMLGPNFVHGDATTNDARTSDALRHECEIESRTELRTNPEKLEKFHALERDYETWLQSGAAAPRE